MTNEELAVQAKSGDSERLEALWLSVERFARSRARHIALIADLDCAVDEDDLCQAAYFAMCKAVETFDPSAGKGFIGWFGFYLQNELAAATGYNSNTKRVDPTRSSRSLDAPVARDQDARSLLDMLPDIGAEDDMDAAEHRAYLQQLSEAVSCALDTLTERRASVIRCRFFFGMTLQETADSLGITRQRAQQLELAALEALRKDPLLQNFREPERGKKKQKKRKKKRQG